MKTEVIMKREIMGLEVRQKHKTMFFNLKDLERLGNEYRIKEGLNVKLVNDYFKSPSSKEFISALSSEYGTVYTGSKGRGNERWVHPYLFIDIALWFSPALKVKVYQWIYDNLTVFRDNSGESFKTMSSALLENYKIGGKASVFLPYVAKKIYNIVGVSGDDKWEKASEKQLQLRDLIQNNLCALSYKTKNIDEAFEIIEMIIQKRN